MRRAYKIIRAILLTVIVLAVVLPAALYVALSLPSVQNAIREKCEELLSEEMHAEVTIEDLGIRPFNRVTLRGVAIVSDGDTVAKAKRLGAGVNLYELIFHGRTALNYAEVIGLDLRVSRDSVGAPLNIQPIIDALSGKDKHKPPTKFDVRVNTVIIRESSLSYDILDKPAPEEGIFDRNHLAIRELQADVNLPSIKNGDFNVNLRRLSFVERSGLAVTDIQGDFHGGTDGVRWKGFEIAMPQTHIYLSDIDVNPRKMLAMSSGKESVDIAILPGTHISTTAIAPIMPRLSEVDATVDLTMRAAASMSQVKLSELIVADRGDMFALNVTNAAVKDPMDMSKMRYRVDDATLNIGGKALNLMSRLGHVNPRLMVLQNGLRTNFKTQGSLQSGRLAATAVTDSANVDLKAEYTVKGENLPMLVDARLKATDIDLYTLSQNANLGRVNAEVDVNASISPRGKIDAKGSATITDFGFKGNVYDRIYAEFDYDGESIAADVTMNDAAGSLRANIDASKAKGAEYVRANVEIEKLDLNAMHLTNKWEGFELSANIEADFTGKLPSMADGTLTVSDIEFAGPEDRRFYLDSLVLESDHHSSPASISIKSDIIEGELVGRFDFLSLGASLRDAALRAFPALQKDPEAEYRPNDLNKFDFSFTITHTDELKKFFGDKMEAIYPATIDGNVDSEKSYARVSVDVPFIRNGDKLIENTSLETVIDGNEGNNKLFVTTALPSKWGPMAMSVDALCADNDVDTQIYFEAENEKRYEGGLAMKSTLGREDSQMLVTTRFKPTEIAFGDSIWNVAPAVITAHGMKRIDVDGFALSRSGQYMKIDGTVTSEPTDTLYIDVLDMNLDYIFDALNIKQFILGGDATGRITASSLLSKEPRIESEGIKVKDISYNHCVLGQGLVKCHWEKDRRSLYLDASIDQPDGNTSYVYGDLYPFDSTLDVNIDANHVALGFMENYMKAFSSDITGFGTGKLHLWGTFHDIDMEGNMYAENLRLKLNFTNTYFSTSDSVEIVPGEIRLANALISDPYGNTARLSGKVNYEFFRNTSFDFTVSDVKGMLVYDESAKDNTDWYGRMFVNGGAHIVGDPYTVNIKIKAALTRGSLFTFVLSDMEVADEYTFLTFRDKTQLANGEDATEVDARMTLVEELRERARRKAPETSADYIIELEVGITNQAEIDLVMDEVTGDKIRSKGEGALRIVYTSKDENVQIVGTYTIEEGVYHFSFEDIIRKDFKINKGSTITFIGDPDLTRLNIEAIYELNANLSDLDESFLHDRDLNRTNVPVQAMLNVTGNIQEPDIKFNLRFPTLTSDIDRKVRSIISTDEMLHQQVIYLLALNRFYTPDYMNATKGSELFSVASSTVSSQLRNILGHLSDNLAISPNLRSDRGDFSDVEVDVALSSRLLNNRLLLNGNFGYRDKSLNNNQFIGDFDVEYLLNRPGTIRLKAYSHFNDENYYALRTAATTQGVGVVFRRDFDSLTSFLHKKKKALPDTITITNDSLMNDNGNIKLTEETVTLVKDSLAPSAPKDNGNIEGESMVHEHLEENKK